MMADRPALRQHGDARESWERLPLVSLAATVLMVVKGSSIFSLDQRQRSTSNRASSAWINHFSKYIDQDVLPNLPYPYGEEYTLGSGDSGNSPSLRVTPQMLYELAGTLGVHNMPPGDAPVYYDIPLPMPLLPATYQCSGCDAALHRPSQGHIHKSWFLEPYSAHRVPVFVGQCNNCHTKVFPDRFIRRSAHSDTTEEEVFIPEASAILLGRGRYASRQLGKMLSTCVTTAHLPLSTFATCWNSSGPYLDENNEPLKLSHKHMWRLLIIHHILLFSAPGEELVLPIADDEAEPDDENNGAVEGVEMNIPSGDQLLVKHALAFWPSVPSGHYRTYRLRDTAAHRCVKCAHFHRTFRPGDVTDHSTEVELIEAHRNIVEDPTRIAWAGVIDGIEKLSHKVCLIKVLCL